MGENASHFGRSGAEYDDALQRGISVSGEDRVYFAQGRIRHLRECLVGLGETPRTVLDFGCGSGAASPLLLHGLGADAVLAVDVAGPLLESARSEHGSERIIFMARSEHVPASCCDLAFCNGVFHHIPPSERLDAVGYVRSVLRPGGLFALWENNPWNPGTRYVMSRIPFDRGAVMIFPREARTLVRARGFETVRTDFLFVFPRSLRAFRWMEGALSRLPLGAQYQVLARKIAS